VVNIFINNISKRVKCTELYLIFDNLFYFLGKLYAWGMGTSGQLGTGEDEDVDVPILIESKQLKDIQVIRVSGGGQHTILFGMPSTINKVAA
jgi:alpha-tubulin suppressor-like RCC1 family protein